MSLQLNKIFDNRTPLQKARRKELERFAKEQGVDEVKPGMPAPLMRQILERHNKTNIPLPRTRYLGGPPDMYAQGKAIMPFDPEPAAQQTTEMDILQAEWERETRDYSTLSINELRAECKARGIKLSRRDRISDMIGKLNGQNAP